MLERLLDFTDTEQYEEDGQFHLRHVEFQDDAILLNLAVWISGETLRQKWRVHCLHSLRFLFSSNQSYGSISLENDHVLLWDHIKPQGELLFRGKSSNPRQLSWDLFARHRSVTENWLDYEEYLGHTGTPDFLSGGHGSIAKGPIPLLQEYAGVLSEHGLHPYFFTPGAPPKESHAKVLIFGASYVVASDFEAELIHSAFSEKQP